LSRTLSALPPLPLAPGDGPLPQRRRSLSRPVFLARPHGLRRDQLILLLAILAAFVACFGGLSDLAFRWHRQEEYSHGWFIPPIALWLAWRSREALAQSRGQPSPWGLAVLGVGLAMLLVGELSAIMVLIQLAFLVFLAGLVLCYGGVSLLRVAALPIAVLLFCIPLPYFVESQLTWRLQLVSSSLGVAMLRVMDFSVYLEGNVIDLGTFKLQVVEACSGLRYLYPLLSVGFLMAYMYPAALRWRALVLLSTIPITVLTNSLRIAVTGVLVERWGNAMGTGFLHWFEGWVIFVVCQVVLTLEIMLIERCTRRRNIFDVQQVPAARPVRPSGSGAMPAKAVALVSAGALMMLLAFAAAYSVNGREEIRPQRATLKLFPTELEGWRATEAGMPLDVERALGLDDYVLADYLGPKGGRVNFYVAYYASQRKGVSPHSPQVCIPGGGWVISDLRTVQVPMPRGAPVDAVRVLIDKGRERALVYYWFEGRGRRVANEYRMKWDLLRDAVLRNRTDGALVRVITEVERNEDPGLADARLQRFVRAAVPRLGRFVPD
jgi:exosortase D (VPLPA-CTERM-specific)